MNEDQEILELEIGQIVCFEEGDDNIFTQCEVIAVNELLNQALLLYYPTDESKVKITKWVEAENIFLEDDLMYL